MCGINGVFAYAGHAPPVSPSEVLLVRDRMAARGPDGAGIWISPDNRVGLGHRRLAIIDLSEAGAQPMHSTDGRHVITFNGEIYNYLALRATLESEGVVFRSHSDTEVLLHLYRRDGASMIEKLRGMFALALWDSHARTLLLARDPHGIKPLYYSDDGKTFRFASQVTALKAGGGIDLSPDPAGTVGFLLWGSVPEPLTLHRRIRLLPAGSTLTVGEAGSSRTRPYWSIGAVLRLSSGIADSVPQGSEREYLRAQLIKSVQAHLVSDVPVGAFLSAGLDSSCIVGLAREAVTAPLQTMTLSFDEFEHTRNDECPTADEIARHLDVKHSCVVLPAGELNQELERFLEAMDQPTVDGINVWLISRAAALAGLRVALSGLGGDELLGGYATFREMPAMLAKARRSPWRLVPALYRRLYSRFGYWLDWPPNDAGAFEYGKTPEGAYHLLKGTFMPWELPSVLQRDALKEGIATLAEEDSASDKSLATLHPFDQVTYLETARYMRNQLLRDTDWASMAHSLEIRVPLVDASLTAAVTGLAGRGRLTKADLPEMLARPLPESVRKRPKTGFITPTWKWLRHHPALGAWRSIPLLRDPRVSDARRWAYTLLRRVPEVQSFLR